MMHQNQKKEIYRYHIDLTTQMGIKHGTLYLLVIGNQICGVMQILGERQSIRGERHADGSCTLLGQLQTKCSVFEYTATGRFDRDRILLNLKYAQGTFRLTGQRN